MALVQQPVFPALQDCTSWALLVSATAVVWQSTGRLAYTAHQLVTPVKLQTVHIALLARVFFFLMGNV